MPEAPEVADQVWVTLATNDSYALGALVLGHSLRTAGTKRAMLVMVTPQVSGSMRQILGDVYNEVKEVNVMDSNDTANLALIERPNLGVTFTKLHCWRLTQFTKGVFLDADTMVMQNCDELFDREELSAAPDCGWPDCFNSGVFVFSPSEDTYESLLNFAVTYGSFDGGDQGLLNLYFSDWAHKDIQKHLPFVYNMVATATYSYLPAVKQFGKDVKIIHFLGSTKPWMHQYDPASGNVTVFGGPAHQHVQGYLKLWWDLFAKAVLPKMTGDYGLVDNFDFMAALRRMLPAWMIYNPEAEQAYHEGVSQAAESNSNNALFMESFQPDSHVWHEFIPQAVQEQQRRASPEPVVPQQWQVEDHGHGEPQQEEQKFPWGEFRHERFVPEYILEKRQLEESQGHDQHHDHGHHHHHDQHGHHEHHEPHHEPWQDFGIPKPQDSFSYGESLPPPPPPPAEPQYHPPPHHDHDHGHHHEEHHHHHHHEQHHHHHPPPQPPPHFFQPYQHEDHPPPPQTHHDHGHHQQHDHGHHQQHDHGHHQQHDHGHDQQDHGPPPKPQYPSWGPVWERFPVGGPNLPAPILQPGKEIPEEPTREQFEKSDTRRPMIWHMHPVGGPQVPLERRIHRQFKKSKSRLEAEKRRVAENQRRRQLEAEAQEVKSVETLKKENLMGLKFTKIKRLPSRPEEERRTSPTSGATSSDDSGFTAQQEKQTSPPPQFTPPPHLLSMCTGMFRGKSVKMVNGTPTVVPTGEATSDPISNEEKVLIKHKVRSSRVPTVAFSKGVQTDLSLLEDLIPVLMTSTATVGEDPAKKNLGPMLDEITKEEEQIVPEAATPSGPQTKTYVPSDYVPMSSSALVSMLKDKAAGLMVAAPPPRLDHADAAGMNQRKPAPMQSI